MQLCLQEPTPIDAVARITVDDLDAMAGDRPPPGLGTVERVANDPAPREPAPLGNDVPAGPAPVPQQSAPDEHQLSPTALGGGCVVGIPVHVPQARDCSS